MYECIAVKPYRADLGVLYAEGDLDNESDAEDDDLEEFELGQVGSETSSTRGTDGFSNVSSRELSPMDES
jgi:hypothetical protein